MSATANEPPPEACEAQKWHEVSVRALQWTRSSLAAQQDSTLSQLKDAVLSRRSSAAPITDLVAEKAVVAKPLPLPAQPAPAVCAAQRAAFAAAGLESVGSLRDDLEKLKEYENERCLIVRRIKRLGLSSPTLLRKHFEEYGTVTEVLVAHSFERKSAKCRVDRVRPAALGFLVMGSVAEASAVLRAGPNITVGDVSIEVSIFEPFVNVKGEDATGWSA